MKKIVFIFFILFTCISLNLIINQNNSKTVPTSKKKQEINTDIKGKIKIKNTTINSYILQSTNNEYYLNHNEKKEFDRKGSIFLDYRNHLNDKKLLIYGHNSQQGTAPLKELENYLEKDYYDKNKEIIVTLNNKIYKYQIFSVIITKVGDNTHTKLNFNKKEYQYHLSWIVKNSLYKTGIIPSTKDHILMIQTCYYHPKNSYLLISAKRR